MSAGRIEVVRGDITRLAVDAIVNAANTTLLGGGGVDGAIHRAAGPELLAECRTLGGCPPGASRITRGYRAGQAGDPHRRPDLARRPRGEDEVLASCYRTALALAAERRFARVAFPAISCGVYGFPVPRACRVAVGEIQAHLVAHPVPSGHLVAFDEEVYAAVPHAPRQRIIAAMTVPTVLALDFDGVVCDGRPEYFETAWRRTSPPGPSRWRPTRPTRSPSASARCVR